ncbi:alpha/beta fold hydrolase [Paraburkholderia youngii]|uniref:Alpha/beta hydrolase n=1 Tax=Paraburkholderia youngii TaxID=2782701 RepID=A0A7Y6K1J9_9BURK|nr:alpha/beta hydrolase [Paraburkholderia youngii]NUY01453.1 alpha/beta hydrolase [Paraburkholderia youngii]
MSHDNFGRDTALRALLEEFARRFMAVKRREPRTISPDVDTVTLSVAAPHNWPDGRQVEIRVHRRGKGRRALLVHGWQSQAAELSTLSGALADEGFEVWMPDLPGHGYSSGTHLSIPLAAATLAAVQSLVGPFAYTVGHSYGGASVVHALAKRLRADRVAILASPTNYGHFARRFASEAGLPPSELPQWLELLSAMTGTHPDEISMERQAPHLSLPALLVHGTNDQIVPIEQAKAVATLWQSAVWLALPGVGHFDLLTDPKALKHVVDFGLGKPLDFAKLTG